MKRNLPIILLINLMLLGFWLSAERISAQQQEKLTLAQILTGLQTNGKTAETDTLAKRNVFIAKRVRQLGVTFRLTAEIESELRKAGATDELIQAIREKSPKLPAISDPVPNTINGKEMRNYIGMEFVLVPAGTFMMGAQKDNDENPLHNDEGPLHKVTIKAGFWMSKYEVTQGQWRAIMENNPSYFKECGDNCPVEKVSWNDIQIFLKNLNAKSIGFEYRLPTEAEWEYAARAGTTGLYGGTGNLNEMGWFNENSNNTTHPVGQKKANAFGLYDMHGNVWEWVHDIYNLGYTDLPTDGSANLTIGDATKRIMRGGAWVSYEDDCRSARRGKNTPSHYNNPVGFRVVTFPK